jgi:hypothetical protein
MAGALGGGVRYSPAGRVGTAIQREAIQPGAQSNRVSTTKRNPTARTNARPSRSQRELPRPGGELPLYLIDRLHSSTFRIPLRKLLSYFAADTL